MQFPLTIKMKNPNSKGGRAVASGGGILADGGAVMEECSHCGTKKGWVLHNVRYRGIIRQFCTSCVLRLHPSSFCPYCFLYHDRNSQTAPNNNNNNNNDSSSSSFVSCSKCPSLSHRDCLPPPYAAFSPSSFLCPPCANPKFTFFNLDDKRRVLDAPLAAVLLCAATVANASMSKALAIARAEAERRVREAAVARKRAREALDELVLRSKAKASATTGVSGTTSTLASNGVNGQQDTVKPV